MSQAVRPNILLITSDQQHWFTLGVQNQKIKTPNLDRLCREETRFDRAYTVNPYRAPSRASIITGMYPSWHGAWSIGVHLPEDVPTVGDIFQHRGYSAQLIGKAHFQPQRDTPGYRSLETKWKAKELDFWRDFHAPWYGFEYVETLRNHGDGPLTGSHYGVWLEDEHGIRVPFVVRYPGVVPACGTSEALQSLVDLPQTFLDFADIPIPGQMQGVSQRRVWEGAEESALNHEMVGFSGVKSKRQNCRWPCSSKCNVTFSSDSRRSRATQL